ncbi:hypothetical protein BEP19_09675 [Ammoniphilus oxalaticus]|uniref:Uncharacterized protein n=1 Tax=Ammoniphilus oxalaticus TaxID=66863 RepID=A0A419SKV1_9BACL|nr:hypothetical protein [Ammoniphilus oxalaticus]RKD24633.1 hypothetical protein BEP19_09675 [Ammoniphilus oxalaticus]
MPKYEIFKQDNWNMILADVKGTKIEVLEISSEWGEDKHVFYSRPEMMHWVHSHYKPEEFVGRDQEYEQIIENFKKI